MYQPVAEERIYYPNTDKSDNLLVTDATNCTTPSDYNDLCGILISIVSVANKMFYLLSVGGVIGIGITNEIRIVLNANKNHWLRHGTFHVAKTDMISTASGYGDTEDGVDMQEQVRTGLRGS